MGIAARSQPVRQDVAVELLSLEIGRDAQVPHKRIPAICVELQSPGSIAPVGKNPHHRAADRFSKAIPRQQLAPQSHHIVGGCVRQTRLRQALDSLACQVLEPLPLRLQPLLELRRRRIDAGQKLAAVQCKATVACPGKPQGVNFKPAWIKHYGVAAGRQRSNARCAKCLPKRCQRLPKAVTSLCFPTIGPEQPGELGARLRPGVLQSQVGEQQTVLPRR